MRFKHPIVCLFRFAALAILLPSIAYAGQGVSPLLDSAFVTSLVSYIAAFTATLEAVLFYKVLGFPILVAWLVVGGVFFTVRLGFVNIRLFTHSIDVVRGKYSKGDEPGEVTHFQALVAAVSATVGLGNIAGVAIAVSLGGPGAVIWMVIAGALGMSSKFAEVTMGQKYRHVDDNGKVSGGAFYYLQDGLADMNLPRLGRVLAIIFAIFCVGGAFGAGNLFQAHEAIAIMTDSFTIFNGMGAEIGLVMAVAIGVVLIGGIRRIAVAAELIVPFMAFIYIIAAIVVLIVNAEKVPAALLFMLQDAFTGVAVGGGLVGALIAGFKRAAFSSEAGLGSAPIAHAAAKTDEPVREGCVGLLEPFIDTVIICFMTGLVITVTGVYEQNNAGDIGGVLLTSQAFATVVDWFPKILAVAVMLFAFSTMMTWSYYGERAWGYLFGYKRLVVYHLLFCSVVFLAGFIDNIGLVVTLSDLLILSMAIPNLIGLYIMHNKIKAAVDEYVGKLKAGKFKKYS